MFGTENNSFLLVDFPFIILTPEIHYSLLEWSANNNDDANIPLVASQQIKESLTTSITVSLVSIFKHLKNLMNETAPTAVNNPQKIQNSFRLYLSCSTRINYLLLWEECKANTISICDTLSRIFHNYNKVILLVVSKSLRYYTFSW